MTHPLGAPIPCELPTTPPRQPAQQRAEVGERLLALLHREYPGWGITRHQDEGRVSYSARRRRPLPQEHPAGLVDELVEATLQELADRLGEQQEIAHNHRL